MRSRSLIKLRHVSQLLFFLLFVLLLVGTVCTLTLSGSSYFVEPLGLFQLILSSRTIDPTSLLFIGALAFGAAVFLFLVILLGRAFCAWACPIGTIVEFVDIGLKKVGFSPLLTRLKRGGGDGSKGIFSFLRNPWNKYAFLGSALTGSAFLGYPVWCVFCPIGTVCRGAIAGAELAVSFEMGIVPLVGGMSLGERWFWCKYLCPVGALQTLVSKLNPFFKPVADEGKCTDCGSCRKICPEDIDLSNNPSLAKCTKCLECYVSCPNDAVRILAFKNPLG